MAEAKKLDLKRTRGDTAPLRLAVKNETTKQPVNITGYSATLTVDPEEFPANSTNNKFQITGTVFDGPNGIFEFPLTQQQADEPPARLYYDAQWTDGSGDTFTFVRGAWIIGQDITK